MDQLDFPKSEEWERRHNWFENQFDVERRGGGYIIGEHTSAMLIDLQAIFYCGSYISAVILSCLIVDAHLREAESHHKFDGGMQAAFNQLSAVSDLEWLRQRRNDLVYWKRRPVPVLTVDDQWFERDAHEIDARRAICLAAAVLFENPWT